MTQEEWDELRGEVNDLRERIEALEDRTPEKLGTCYARIYLHRAEQKFSCSRPASVRCSKCHESRCGEHVRAGEDGAPECYMGCGE